MMPRVDGLDVCRILRPESDLPVLMLTARSTEDDLLLGLDLGADDYMTKPYSPRELVARVRTHLAADRRHGAGSLRVGALVVDPARHEVARRRTPRRLHTGRVPAARGLAAEPGRVFTRQQLLGYGARVRQYVTGRTVDVHVMNLRRKIETDPAQAGPAVTVYGVGYKLVEESPSA